VGKTCLMNRYVNNEFGNTHSTIGASFALKTWKGYKLGIWDTAGQEIYDSLSKFYCRGAGAALLVYDITDTASFEKVAKYLKLLEESCDQECFLVLVGSKFDLVSEDIKPRAVAISEAKSFAEKVNAVFFETSSKTGHNINDVFECIGNHFVDQVQSGNSVTVNRKQTVNLKEKPQDGQTQSPLACCKI